jgi:hypothetical protein
MELFCIPGRVQVNDEGTKRVVNGDMEVHRTNDDNAKIVYGDKDLMHSLATNGDTVVVETSGKNPPTRLEVVAPNMAKAIREAQEAAFDCDYDPASELMKSYIKHSKSFRGI